MTRTPPRIPRAPRPTHAAAPARGAQRPAARSAFAPAATVAVALVAITAWFVAGAAQARLTTVAAPPGAGVSQAPRTAATPAGGHATVETPGTFSILGYDPDTGELGGAVQSRVFSVGNGVLWAEAGVGAVATQAIVDVSYGPQGLALLRQGLEPEEVIRRVYEADPDPFPEPWPRGWPKAGRQFAVLDAHGHVAAFTGPQATEWAGHRTDEYVTAQGNILAGPEVVEEMIRAFKETKGHLSFRLLAALEAGQAAGGDRRGQQSAAMLIVNKDGGVWLHNDVVLRLQVDDSPEPIRELRRLVEIAAQQREAMRRFREQQQRARQQGDQPPATAASASSSGPDRSP